MKYLPALAVSLFAFAAQAQGVATFFYQRGVVHVLRATPPAPEPLPWQEPGKTALPEAPMIDIPVEIRPATALSRQEGWVSMGSLPARQGMVFLYDTPQQAYVGKMDYYQPLDVIWVGAQGEITSIAPNLVLANNASPIVDSKPCKLLLMMAGGSAQQLGINPGDKLIDSEYFVVPPTVLKPAAPPAGSQ